MPIPNDPQVCSVTMYFQRDTRVMLNTFHVLTLGSWNLSGMNAIASLFHSWWGNYYKAGVPAAVALTQVSVRLLDPTNPLAVDLPVTPSEPGTRVGQAEGGNVTLTISWRTDLAGRLYRGRIYVPALSEGDVNQNDTVVSTEVAILAIAAAQLISQLVANSTPLVVFHRPNIPPHVHDNTSTTITSYIVENVVDSQRRRLPGRGR